MLVFLADLRHDTLGLSPECTPLGIGYLASYSRHVLGPEVQFKLFAYPQQLIQELRHTKPDMLGVTNYCWNYALHCRILRYARGLYPDLLTVMGGPNMPLDHKGEEAYLRRTPCLDLYVINEGEQAFASLLDRCLDSGLNRTRLFQKPILSSIFVDPDSAQVVRGTPTLRMRQLDDLPSPYLTGLMDQFFDDAFCPMIQTNRGCPFTCTFCVEGVSYMTKVNKFSADRVREELRYMARRVSVGSPLMISDSNFGMLPGDNETAASIHELQTQVGWPKVVRATTGKNNKEAILSAIELLDGAMKMTNSVQSMDSTVLVNIKRSNIKMETYASLQQEVKNRNLQSYAEVIIGLPGETKESFIGGIGRLLDSGVQTVGCYQLMLLNGTELNDQQTRNKYDFKTRFRVLARCFGTYAEEPVFEVEEIVIATNSMSFDDYMEVRRLQLVLQIYHREGLFKELLEYLRFHQVSISTFIVDLQTHLNEAPEKVRDLFANYLLEARDELFDSAESAHQVMAADYQRLLQEEIGGNLQQKYSALAWFRYLEPVVHYGIQRAKELVVDGSVRGAAGDSPVDRELEAIQRYLLAVVINLMDTRDQFEDRVVPLEYDVAGWESHGGGEPLSAFRHAEPASGNRVAGGIKGYVFYVPEARAAYLRDNLRIFGTSVQGIGKLLYRVQVRDLRRQIMAAEWS